MNRFDGEIRITKVLNDDELRASLRGGWDKELPAIKDEHGTVLVGHRRLKIAHEEGIEPVIKVVTFGDGPEGQAARIRLANVSNIGGAPLTAEDRRAQAERLYASGLTMEAIGHMLGVSHKTISLDLTLYLGTKSPDRVDRLGRKNTGRPKSSGKPRKNESLALREESVPAEVAAERIVDGGKSYKEAEREPGLSNTVLRSAVAREEGRREAVRQAPVDPATLSLTAQEKLEAAIRQATRKLEAEFESRVQAECRRWLDEMSLPAYAKEIKELEWSIRARKGVMDKATFNKVRRALHPDSRHSISDKVLADAFDTFMGLEKFLLDEKESPTEFRNVPRTWQEMMEMKAKVKAERRAKREAAVGSRSPTT